MSAVIELEAVDRTYPGPPPVDALRAVDLCIDAGETVGIVGPSGSGKSTLLNIMGTLDRPTRGRVALDGVPTDGLSDRALCGLRSRALGFVFQGFHLLEGLSVEANVATGLLYRGVDVASRRTAARRALDRVGLADKAAARPPQLSGGQRQRVAIARALVGEPALVLADEPTGNLDSVTTREILELLAELNRDEGTTIAVITHEADVAAAMQRTIRVLDGRVVDGGAP